MIIDWERKEVKLEEIDFPEDYKKDTGELELIRESIKNHGLFHPPILRGDPPYKIIAGRARILALKQLNIGSFTALFCRSDQNYREISLHENLCRHNLPWYEQVEYEKELHNLRISQYGQTKSGRPSGDKKGWSLRDTAKELGIALGTLSQDIDLSNALSLNPNLRNIKDKTTALKVIKNIVKRQSAEFEQAMPSELTMDDVYLGDSEVILRQFPNETFDCCITDPPWSEYKEDNLKCEQEKLLPVYFELYRVMKRDSFLFLVTSTTDLFFYKKELPKLGFRVQAYPLIWHKTKTITLGRTPWQFARDYEPIVLAVKGNPCLTPNIEVSSVLTFDNVHYTKMIHPHEKPISLIEYLLRLSTHPGAKVIDIFAGSGVTLEACKKNDRRYIGIERDKDFYSNIVERLKK